MSHGFIYLHFAVAASIIFLCTSSSTGKNTNYNYQVCSDNNVSCGTIQNVGYPFWGQNRPKFCGRPEFFLSCNQNNNTNPVIILSSATKAVVMNLDTSSHTMLLSLQPFSNHYDDIRCWPVVQKTSVANMSHAFRLTKRVTTISLFFNCTSNVSRYHFKSLACNSSSNNPELKAPAYYVDQSREFDRISKLCTNQSSDIPVLNSGLEELSEGNVTLLSVLSKGFEVDYFFNYSECSNCQSSGGTCGSDLTSPIFVCYCRDGPHPQTCHKSGSRKLGLILASAAIAIAIVILMLCALVIFMKRRATRRLTVPWTNRTTRNKNLQAFLKSNESFAPKRYTYTDIRLMTNSFKHKLGEGGYGLVYKGKLSNGQLVAVKKLKTLKDNGEEFINEVVSIGRTNHVNIVSLLGFCFQGNKRALVYEFMPNGSLEKFIQNAGNGQALSQERMFNIAVGTARGLDYLHRGCNTRILHFDIKPHNILLDQDFCPKISDFGLAKLSVTEDSSISMLEARGTIGYIAPEVFCRNYGSVSPKSDVYSYGMMVLDMACGRKNVSIEVQHSSESYFPEWIYNQIELGEVVACDGTMNDEEKEQQKKMILVALWCIQTYPSNRPSINAVLEMLEGQLDKIQLPPKPYLCSPPRSAVHPSETLPSSSA